MSHTVVLAGNQLNFQKQWDSTWASISGALGGVATLAGVVGMLLVVGSILSYFWQKRKGGGDTNKVLYTLIIGALLAAPTLISLVLLLVDAIGNVVISVFSSNAKH